MPPSGVPGALAIVGPHLPLTLRCAGPKRDPFFIDCPDGNPSYVAYPVDPFASGNAVYTCSTSDTLYCVDPGTPYPCLDGRVLQCATLPGETYDHSHVQDADGNDVLKGDSCFADQPSTGTVAHPREGRSLLLYGLSSVKVSKDPGG